MIEELYGMWTERLAEWAWNDRELTQTLAEFFAKASKPSKAIASRFIKSFRDFLFKGKERWVLIDAGENLRVWNGRWHEEVRRPKLFLKELSRRVFETLGGAPVHQEFTSAMVASGLMDALLATDAYRFTPDRRYIAMRNGVLDLGTWTRNGYALKEHSATRQTDIVLDFDYIAPADARVVKIVGETASNLYKLWEDKLGEIMPGKEARTCFQEFCGAVLTGRDEYRTEYLCILMGPGSNGKSVLVNAIAGVFGEEYVGRYSLEQLFKGDRRDRFVADLDGKILNVADDISAKGFDSADFKKAVGGDGVQGMRAYATDPLKVKIPPLLGACNRMPEVKDDSWGYYRRILQLLTGNTFGQRTAIKRDPRLLATLKQDPCRLAILHWMLEGRRRFVKNNGEIEIPKEMEREVASMMDESSPHRMWIRDCGYARAQDVTPENGTWVPIQTLFDEYAAHSVKAGFTQSEYGRRNGLSSFLRREGYKDWKRRPEQGNVNYLMRKI